MQPPETDPPVRSVRGARLLGWFIAANAAATLVAVIGANSPAADAAHQIALWCGIG